MRRGGTAIRVRVYDRKENFYFASEVYAIVNTGYFEKYLVLQEKSDNSVLLAIDYLDKNPNDNSLQVNINVITDDEDDVWVRKNEKELAEINNILAQKNRNDSLYEYRGYSYFLEQQDTLIKLLHGKEVPICAIIGFEKMNSHIKGWDYIETQQH